jgi:glycosyltransferase involved in cell wall biosynthesis
MREVAHEGLEGAVKFLPGVSDPDLVLLMNGATALLFVSLYEGFGLPILEAMACGTPVVTSSVSSMPEVAGDAAVLVDPADEEAISEAMWQLLRDQDARRQLVEAGRRRVQEFAWERLAQRYVEVYESLA